MLFQTVEAYRLFGACLVLTIAAPIIAAQSANVTGHVKSTGGSTPLQPKVDFTWPRSEEHTSELQSHLNLVCRLLLEKKKTAQTSIDSQLALDSQHRMVR